jgi:hypothetical protein
MEASRQQKAAEKDGEIFLAGLPYKKGQCVEIILLSDASTPLSSPRLTARQLLQSDLVGLWEDRTDIKDSSEYARQLREQAQI